MASGDTPSVQRVIRRAYEYLKTEPPADRRVTVQPDSHLHYFLKSIVIGLVEELENFGGITLPEEPAPESLHPKIPNDPDVEV